MSHRPIVVNITSKWMLVRYPFPDFSICYVFSYSYVQLSPNIHHGCSQTHCLSCPPLFIHVSANGVDDSWFLTFETSKSLMILTFPLLSIPRPLPSPIIIFMIIMSRIYLFSCIFLVIFFFYALFSHPLLPQSESHLELKVLVRSHLHQKVHGYLLFPSLGDRIISVIERTQALIAKDPALSSDFNI